MNKYGAAFSRLGRAVIMAYDQDDVVGTIFAPEPLGAGGIRQSYEPIIGGIIWRVAPAVTLAQRAEGERAIGVWQSIRAVEAEAEMIGSEWGFFVAFAALRGGNHSLTSYTARVGFSAKLYCAGRCVHNYTQNQSLFCDAMRAFWH